MSENPQFIEQNVVIFFCSSLCLLRLVFPSLAFLNGRDVLNFGHSTPRNYIKFYALQVIIRVVISFIF